MERINIIYSYRLLFILLFVTFFSGFSSICQDYTFSCSFTIEEGSKFSGKHTVEVDEENAFAYNDSENDQFVIEINGMNEISLMLITESLTEGKHIFSMEMQVLIEIMDDDNEEYISFSNYKENGGGYIQFDTIDNENHFLSGSFSGIFHEDMVPEDQKVQINGTFTVKLE